jgi:predicted transcriptional regulator
MEKYQRKPRAIGDFMMLTARVPADLFKNAQSVARSRDETLSQVVRRALRIYVESSPVQSDLVDAVRVARAQKRGGVKAPPRRKGH